MDFDVFWGDFHKHMTGPGTEEIDVDLPVENAKDHLDIVAAHCYPFKWYKKGRVDGIREESTGHDPEFESWWEEIESVSQRHNDPGNFVTFPAYEWHGNRSRWGDHNVYYREEGYPIDDAWDLPELLENMEERDAFVLPHHTAYEIGNRGKRTGESMIQNSHRFQRCTQVTDRTNQLTPRSR